MNIKQYVIGISSFKRSYLFIMLIINMFNHFFVIAFKIFVLYRSEFTIFFSSLIISLLLTYLSQAFEHWISI